MDTRTVPKRDFESVVTRYNRGLVGTFHVACIGERSVKSSRKETLKKREKRICRYK